MPGFDGTGPRGMGPMTGGGRGFCAVPLRTDWPISGDRGVFHSYGLPFNRQMAREQELGFLKTQAQVMREQLKHISDQIQQLGDET